MNVPIRGLSQYGIVTDVDPYDLPPTAWSFGVNTRFHNGSVLRAPVFRKVLTLGTTSPRFVIADIPNTGFSSIITAYKNGTVSSVLSGVESDYTVVGYTANDSTAPYTSCRLADLLYINREDRIPWSLTQGDTAFTPLANWNTAWRAHLLRSLGGALVALGVTKSGISYPTMVKTSEFALAGTVPSTWDETDPTTNATENVLAEMRGPITDAQPLGEIMCIYGLEETWTMNADGSENVWAYHKLYGDKGAINANCVIELDKRHYVFGKDDIWVHDGVSTPVSLCDKRVRNFIFSSLNFSKASQFFVHYNPLLKELHFNYVSGDKGISFDTNFEGCNRSAVYNVVENTWTFYDLPYIFSAAEANVDNLNTWASLPDGTPWNVGGTWYGQEDNAKRVVVMVGDANTKYGLSDALYAHDVEGPYSVVSLATDTNATKGWYLERDGIDLDELKTDLQGYKLIRSIYPQARLAKEAEPLTFTFGASDYFNQPPTMVPPQTYDGFSLYKLDFNAAGRYLFLKVSHDDTRYVSLSGFDLDVDVLGER